MLPNPCASKSLRDRRPCFGVWHQGWLRLVTWIYLTSAWIRRRSGSSTPAPDFVPRSACACNQRPRCELLGKRSITRTLTRTPARLKPGTSSAIKPSCQLLVYHSTCPDVTGHSCLGSRHASESALGPLLAHHHPWSSSPTAVLSSEAEGSQSDRAPAPTPIHTHSSQPVTTHALRHPVLQYNIQLLHTDYITGTSDLFIVSIDLFAHLPRVQP